MSQSLFNFDKPRCPESFPSQVLLAYGMQTAKSEFILM